MLLFPYSLSPLLVRGPEGPEITGSPQAVVGLAGWFPSTGLLSTFFTFQTPGRPPEPRTQTLLKLLNLVGPREVGELNMFVHRSPRPPPTFSSWIAPVIRKFTSHTILSAYHTLKIANTVPLRTL